MALKELKDESPVDFARRKIKAAGYFVKKVQRVFAPVDTHDETEVWFWGRPSKESNAPAEQLTAYIPNDPNGEATIAAGW